MPNKKCTVYTVDGREVRALTKLHANGTDAAREPAINKGLGDDVYLAPMPGKENNRLEILPSITEESSQPIMTSVSVKPCIWLL